ncbi:MAG: type II secretion system F family protein [Christensenellales bacterium]|jgi:type IV pilus assembly protein PilC
MSGAGRRNSGAPPLELAVFCRQMAVIAKSDIPLSEGVELTAEQTGKGALKKALNNVLEDMRSGVSFAAAISRRPEAFPEYFIAMLKIGEASGTIDTTLTNLARHYEKEHKQKRRLRSAMAYPMILGALMIAVIIILLTSVLPVFSKILGPAGTELPQIAKNMLLAGAFFERNIVYILLAIAIICVAAALMPYLPGGRRFIDKLKLRLPGLRKVNSDVITARYAGMLGTMLKGGIPIATAADMAADNIGNAYAAERLRGCNEAVKCGGSLKDALGGFSIFPELFLRIITVGERAGSLDTMLNTAAKLFEEEADSSIERFTASIEPVMITVLSLVAGFIILSVLIPMTGVISSIG